MGRKRKESLPRAVVISTITHIVVILLVLLLPSNFLINPHSATDLIWVELPKGTGEDIYGVKGVDRLPESTIQDQQMQPEKPPEPKPPEDKKEVAEEKKPEPDKKAMAEPKIEKSVSVTATAPKKTGKKRSAVNDALSKIDKRLEQRRNPEAAQIESTGEGYKYGTSDKPNRLAIDDPDYLKYQALVRAKIMSQWVLPGTITQLTPNTRPVVRIVVNINKTGNVVSMQYSQRSSVESLNASAMRAIERASPFPEPPERLKWEAYNEGFLVEFNARAK